MVSKQGRVSRKILAEVQELSSVSKSEQFPQVSLLVGAFVTRASP